MDLLKDISPSLQVTVPVSDIGHLVQIIRDSSGSSNALQAFSNGMASFMENAKGSISLSLKYVDP